MVAHRTDVSEIQKKPERKFMLDAEVVVVSRGNLAVFVEPVETGWEEETRRAGGGLDVPVKNLGLAGPGRISELIENRVAFQPVVEDPSAGADHGLGKYVVGHAEARCILDAAAIDQALRIAFAGLRDAISVE